MSTPLLIDLNALRSNLEQIWSVIRRTACRILLDQSGFPAWPLYPLLGLYLSGTVGSTRPELERGLRWMDRDSHGLPAPDCSPEDFADLLPWCSHLTFADLSQWRTLGSAAHGLPRGFQVRATERCAGGVPLSELPRPLPKGISALRLTLREPDPRRLAEALSALEDCFGGPPHLFQISLGGPWPLTDPDFDLPALEHTLRDLRERWRALPVLEVGEAVRRGAILPPEGLPEHEFPEDFPALWLREDGVVRPFSGF